MSVAAVVHGKLQHASHEDCVVPHAGTIHRPQVDVMGIGTHNDIMEHLIEGESQIQVTIQQVRAVFVVVHGSIQPGSAPKLDLDDGEINHIVQNNCGSLPDKTGALNSKIRRVLPQGIGSLCLLLPCMLGA